MFVPQIILSTDESKDFMMLNWVADLCVFSGSAGGLVAEPLLMCMSSTVSVRKPGSRWYSVSGHTSD